MKGGMNDLDAKAKAIFLEAIEQPSSEGLALFLDAACGGDRALRARVEELLRAHGQAGQFLGGPSRGQDDSMETAAERPGTTLGPYKLIEQIGEGGFGIEFLAEQQQPVRRLVALKVLKPGMDSRQVIARFEAERQALALMDHPNIARVLDAGQTSLGRPYFVMELVKGIPITRFCDQQQLTPRERLELFRPVCAAVQHAHQKGIIHRDLKPTNVLIAAYDGQPVPKVIDFGVAKALGQQLTERTLVTGFGGIIGTLEYMSPEQAEFNALDVDTRADIYSLGVLLYELLTGTTPLTTERMKQAAITEALRLIREEEPPKPSSRLTDSKDSLASVSAQRKLEPARLTREVRGDLDWIVMKCLEKDRARRYATANGLARDIERYLSDEPVEASPPSRLYRLRKFGRKNRKLIATAMIIFLLLVAGSGVSTWQAAEATGAKHDAQAAAAAETQAKLQATASEAETQTVLDFVEKRIIAAARPEGRDGGLGHGVTLRLALEAALPVVDTSFTSQPLTEARLRMTLGESFRYLGDAKIAAEQYQRARALYLEHFGPDDARTLANVDRLAACFADLDDQLEALKLREDTLARRTALLGPHHRDTLRSRQSLASSYAALGRRDKALELDESTLALQKAYLGVDDPDTLASMSNLAHSYQGVERFTDALQLNKDVVALRKARHGPDHPDTLASMNNLASCYKDLGTSQHDPRQFQEALKIERETLERCKAKLGPTHPDTIQTIYSLANTYGFLEQRGEALKLHQQALDLRRTKFGPDHRLTLWSTWGVAAQLFALNRGAEGVQIIDEVLERASHLPTQPDLVGLANNRSLYFERRKDAAGCRRTAELWENLHRTDARSLYNCACYRAVAAKVLRATDRSAAGTKAFETEANRAMAWLQQAVAAGYKKADKIKEDSDLDALRDRADFRHLISQLEAGAGKQKK
jgi:serine/threonine protein kinase/tetratricopeptide (TPR) repeat protein